MVDLFHVEMRYQIHISGTVHTSPRPLPTPQIGFNQQLLYFGLQLQCFDLCYLNLRAKHETDLPWLQVVICGSKGHNEGKSES